MSETIAQVRKLIEGRLQHVGKETAQLQRVLEQLTKDGAAPQSVESGRGRGGRKGSSSGRRAGRGERRRQFLDAVRENPGVKAGDLAAMIGVSPNQGYALARQLRADRKIRKSGKGYRVRESASA